MTQPSFLQNVLIQATNPSRLRVMVKKVKKRLKDKKGEHSAIENHNWIRKNSRDFADFAAQIDPILWDEAEDTSERLQRNAGAVLENIEYDLGGGGIYPLLYFITRYIKPEVVVETGVAAGFSSYSFLAALEKNGSGKLYSSDFPYFRLPKPESYIGIVVDESLKKNWELYIDGDETSLPRILSQVSMIDLFHYDSDKSYSGRSEAMALVAPRMHEKTILLMDDIQDNSFFMDYVQRNNRDSWHVFEFEGKYVGMVGTLPRNNDHQADAHPAHPAQRAEHE